MASDYATRFLVEGVPVQWRRARRNGKRYFTDPKQAAFQDAVAAAAREVMGLAPIYAGPVAMEVVSFLPIPPSWAKAKRARALAGTLLPIGQNTGDADNHGKAVADALNEVVYRDDAQIVDLRCRKFYDARPRIEVAVYAV